MFVPSVSLAMLLPQHGPITPKQPHFSASQPPLFRPEADRVELEQGALPNCQLLAVLLGMSRKPLTARILDGMIAPQPDGSFQVTFEGKAPIRITPDELEHEFERRVKASPQLPLGEEVQLSEDERVRALYDQGLLPAHATADTGIRILELAYAKLEKRENPALYPNIPDSKAILVYRHPNYHQNIVAVLEAFLKQKNWTIERLLVSRFSLNSTLDQLASTAPKGLLFLNTWAQGRGGERTAYLEAGMLLKKGHSYFVERINPSQRTVLLRDPQNSRIGLEVPYDELPSIGRHFIVAQPTA